MNISRPLRVLVVSPDYPPPFVGGSLAWIFELIENCDHQCDVLAAAQRFTRGEAGRQRVRRSRWLVDSQNPGTATLAVGYAFMAGWMIWQGIVRRYDLILANPGVIGNVLLFWLGWVMRMPVVGTAYSEEITLVLHGTSRKARVKQWLMKGAYRRAKGFVAVCDAARDLLTDLGVDRSSIDVIPPGFSHAKLARIPEATPREPGLRLLTVGRLIERKGFQDTVTVVDRLRADMPSIHLTIVGDGPMRGPLEEQIKQRGLHRHVTMAGAASDSDLARLYLESDLFVLANRMLANGDIEGCPVVFAEAAAYGLPVVGGKAGGASSLVEDGRTGLLVAADNLDELTGAIRHLLSNPAEARRMGAAGRERIITEHAPPAIGRRFTHALDRQVK